MRYSYFEGVFFMASFGGYLCTGIVLLWLLWQFLSSVGGRVGGCAPVLAGVGVLFGWLLTLVALQPLQLGFWGTGLSSLLAAQRISLLAAVASLGVYYSYLRQ
jgi:hypothetical protein